MSDTSQSNTESAALRTARAVVSDVLFSAAQVSPRAVNQPALSPNQFMSLRIREVTTLSHDTKAFDVLLPHDDDVSGLVTSSFIMIKGADDEAKPYTPVSPCDQRGWFRLVVKAYPGGVVSSYLHTLRAGDHMQVKGPFFKLKYEPNAHKRVGMIAGGTGITPMLQVIREIIKNPEDKTQVHLVFQNRTEEDVSLLREEIDSITSKHANITVTYILSRPSDAWTGLRGRVNAALLAETMPPAAEGDDAPLIYVCGPPGMLNDIAGPKAVDKSQGELLGLLKDAGYSASMVFKV